MLCVEMPRSLFPWASGLRLSERCRYRTQRCMGWPRDHPPIFVERPHMCHDCWLEVGVARGEAVVMPHRGQDDDAERRVVVSRETLPSSFVARTSRDRPPRRWGRSRSEASHDSELPGDGSHASRSPEGSVCATPQPRTTSLPFTAEDVAATTVSRSGALSSSDPLQDDPLVQCDRNCTRCG